MLKPNKLANNNFLSSLDLSADEVYHVLELANSFKNKKINIDLNNKVLGLILIRHRHEQGLVFRSQCQDWADTQLI